MDLESIRSKAFANYSATAAYKNPYSPGTQEFNAYERGWMQALKRDSAKPQYQEQNPVNGGYGHQQPTGFNLYAEKKGRSGPRQ